MADRLTADQVRALVADAVQDVRHEACHSCECFQGYLVQLEMDADPAAQEALQPYRRGREETHSCLGCEPCPSGEHYARYLRGGSCGGGGRLE
jgi:hypothetical protein